MIFLLWHASQFFTKLLISSDILSQNILLLIFSSVRFSPKCPPWIGSWWYSVISRFLIDSGTNIFSSPLSFNHIMSLHSLHFSFSLFSPNFSLIS
ncbi:unnamed protein product [Meloidogyne enterolobii]|uniref:Uncharacterized protein n=1 Tax=Meloidogyne enterolobii TaxID=390850 RepID=A0ACB0YK46_MELEN